MAIKHKKKGFLGRSGPRYGRKLREKLFKIETEQKKSHKCPYCYKMKTKRIMTGIWYCQSCNTKFAGKAYTRGQKPVLKLKEDKFDENIIENIVEDKTENGTV